MAINLTTKYSDKVLERFTKQSLTASAASKDYEFEGIKTLKIYSVDTAPLNDYTRSGTSRYGTVSELQDTTQTLTMTQDKSFTYSIDKGNEKEQLNIKSANRSLKREIDEVITPTLDKYNLSAWCRNAGSMVTDGGTAPTKNTITGLVMDCTEMLDEAFAPEVGRTMFITNAQYKLLKQNPDFLSVDNLAEKALVKGQVGEIDGMKVVKVPTKYMPANVYWLIVHKGSILAPSKLQDYKIHSDPPGINGDLVEGRIMHDAFVLGTKAAAVCICAANSAVLKTASITDDTSNSKYTLSNTTSGATYYYTTDGTDPRYSDTKTAVPSGGIPYASVEGAKVLKVAGISSADGTYNSNVAELTL